MQMTLDEQARDAALDHHERTKAELVEAGREWARKLAAVNGTVSSPEVFRALRAAGWGAELDAANPTWMGAVFRRGWERVGYEPSGSHCRPVSVWRLP